MLHAFTFTEDCYENLSLYMRLDRLTLDMPFNDTGRKGRGQERQTDSGFVTFVKRNAKKIAKESRFALCFYQGGADNMDSGPLVPGLV